MNTAITLLSLLFLFHITNSNAQVITVRIPVEDYSSRVISGPFGDWIGIPGHPLIAQTGAPCLPEIPMKIALPAHSRALSMNVIEITYSEWMNIESIIPVSEQVPVSLPGEFKQAEPDPAVYHLDVFYPEDAVYLTGSSVLWGIPIATIVVNPVRWNPVSGELEVLSELILEMEIEYDPALATIQRRAHRSELTAMNLLKELVVNPDDVSSSGAVLVREKDLEYGQYVIICPPELENEMQILADWKTSKGVPAAVYTTDWIQANYSFSDIQREIRAFLTDCRDEGTDYVLLAGDDDVLEARDVYLCAKVRPCDLYFSDINDAYPGEDLWDSNRNGFWAEPGDNVDWHPDLWVARATISTDAEAELFVNKVLYYERANQSWPTGNTYTEPVEMRIGYSTGKMMDLPLIWGSAGAEIISDSLPSGWQEEKRYESTGNNSSALTIEMLNMGMHHVYHCSHGAPTLMWTSWGSEFTVDDILNLENISDGNSVTIWNSIACLIGSFDTLTCCADAWISSPDGGGFGAFNSQYGYFSSSTPGFGVSEQLCQRFYHEYLNNEVFNMGIAHGASLDFFSPPGWNTYMEYVIKSYNIFGDPELPMWTEEHSTLSVLHPENIIGNSTIDVTVSSAGIPLENARVCIQKGSWQTGEVYEVDYTDASGNVQLWVTPETTGQMTVTVWAHNHDHYSGLVGVSQVGIRSEGNGCNNSIESVYPNPAFSNISVAYTTASTGLVEIAIYDMQGRRVVTLVSENCQSGQYSCNWDIESSGEGPISSGLYFVKMSAGSFSASKPLMIIR